MYLILPAAGHSSRFPNMRPKWMLTHPSGNMMLTEAIRGLNLADFEKIYLTILKEHAEQHQCVEGIMQQFEMLGVKDKLSIIMLDKPTQSQPETIAETIRRENLSGAFFCKDTDNYFVHTVMPENCVCVYDLNRMTSVNPSNKSYAQFGEHHLITNIIEKKVISSHFCVGGYGFASTQEYMELYKNIADKTNAYVSDVVFQMILQGQAFHAREVREYLDWGTLIDWNRHKREFSVLFVDIDGTLVRNSGKYLPPYWGETEAIPENVAAVNRLYDSKKVQVILTTSRDEAHRDITIAQLAKCDIKYHQIIFGLYHAKRIVINDYAASNPYRSCDSINIRRDSNDLKHMLEDAFQIP